MDGRLELKFSNKMTHSFKKWTTTSGVLKKTYFNLTKIRGLKYILLNLLNISFPENYNTPKKN